MALLNTSAQNIAGFAAGPKVVGRVTITGNLVKGSIVSLNADLTTGAAATATSTGVHGVLLEASVSGTKARVCVSGRVKIKGTFTAGDRLCAGAAGVVTSNTAEKNVIAYAEESATAALGWCYFDGVNFLGYVPAA